MELSVIEICFIIMLSFCIGFGISIYCINTRDYFVFSEKRNMDSL